jgi:Domain of unknown function (DUF4823)
MVLRGGNTMTMRENAFLALCALAGVMSGCVHTYRVEPAGAARASVTLPLDAPIYVSIPEDGRYSARRYAGSGEMTTQEVVAALSLYTSRVSSARATEPLEESLSAAREESALYLLRPTILHWEDRATEWTGVPDRMSVRLDLVDVATSETVDSKIISGKSRWATFGGDHPQDLLPESLAQYASGLFGQPLPAHRAQSGPSHRAGQRRR